MCAEIECLRLKEDVEPPSPEPIVERVRYMQKSPYGTPACCTNFDNKVIKGGVLVVNLCRVPNVTIISQ